jgi:threonine dehydratase
MNPIPLVEIEKAQERIKGAAIRTPLIRLNVDDAPAEIYLKLENLQPIGSFKIRGAVNAIRQADPALLEKGVWTASAGNMAQGVAWCARTFNIKCTVVVPDHAPEAKLDAMRRLGASFIKVPFTEWFDIILSNTYEGMEGLFIHPVSDPAVIAGNGTIGLEIMEDLPDVTTVIMPYGGGGLSCGIASAFRGRNSVAKLYACEVDTAAPLAGALQADEPVEVPYTKTFIDGMGGLTVLPTMWPLARNLLNGSLVTTVADTAAALKFMAERNRIIAEGAGAAPVAVALSGLAGSGKIVCVVSGGNIDLDKLVTILQGGVP